jgi:dihydrofolate reductase
MTSARPGRLTGEKQKEALMSKIVAGITMSVDGYITGPDDGPGQGLGVGGERLHYWVFGEPWDYESSGPGEASGEDKAYLDEMTGANGAVIAGRGTYEAAGAWGGANPWDVPLFIVTHRPGEQPDGGGFTFTGSLAEAVEQASAAAGDKQVMLMGIIAPVVLGGGKRLFEGFSQSLDLEHLWVRQSPFATFIHYRVKR